MELKDLIRLMWRNVKYIILGLVLGAGVGLFVSKIQPPVYEATAKFFVSRVRQQGNTDMLSLSDEQLLAINLQLAQSQSVLDDVSSQLGSRVEVDTIQAGAIPNTLIIQIKAQDDDPQRAAMTANLLVQTLIQQNDILLSGRYAAFESAINEQADQVQKQIDALQTQIDQVNEAGVQEQLVQVNQQIEQLKMEIASLEEEVASFPYTPSPLERITLAEKQAQLDQLHSLMTLYQQIQTNLIYIGQPGQSGSRLEDPEFATLLSTLGIYQQINVSLINSRENVRLARMQGAQNIMQIVLATPPKDPIRPMPVLYFLLGGVVGLALAASTILLIDHLDDSLKSVKQMEELLGLPVLGSVSDYKPVSSGLITSHNLFSLEAEAFRTLGASVEMISAEKNICTLLVLNVESADTETTIAANLAVVNALRGKKVILLDGDMDRPRLHTLFEIENQNGFAELLSMKLDLNRACQAVSGVKGLTLITGGVKDKESAAWLDAEKWGQLLIQLQRQADLIIINGPSAEVADAQILASKISAVLLVIRPGYTPVDAAQAALRRLQLVGAHTAGIVLNQKTQRQKIKTRILSLLKTKLYGNKDSRDVNAEAENANVLPF